jgi:site-specific DNA-methyltransferase (adenine-specific)
LGTEEFQYLDILHEMKERAPRNRTLIIRKDEKDFLVSQTISLEAPCAPKDIENKLIHQDLFSCIELLPAQFIDLAIIDPPYNLNKQFGDSKFSKTSSNSYEVWLDLWITKLKRCLKNTASLYVCCDWQSSKSVQTVVEKHFIVRNRITWEREKGRGATANWKNCSEDIWFCTVSNEYFFDVEAVKLKRRVIAPYRHSSGEPKDWEETTNGNYRLTHPSNLWTDISIPFWSMPENTDHPTQKPEKLIAKLILASSKPGDCVFDPFFGSGTTCVVAKKLKRKFSGVEQESEYCQMAVKRLIRAESDATIQGYHDGYFWERNSLADQKQSKATKREQNATPGLFDGQYN